MATQSTHKRLKGSGRKFTDGKMREDKFIKNMQAWFMSSYSIRDFLNQSGISRQTYYRLLKKYPKLKHQISSARKELMTSQRMRRMEYLHHTYGDPFVGFEIKVPLCTLEISSFLT